MASAAPEPGRTLSRQRLILFRVLTVSLVILIAELAAQVAVFALVRPTQPPGPTVVQPDPQLGWVYRGRRTNDRGIELRFNTLGLRGAEIASVPVELMILGDSVVMGSDIAESKTFASRLRAVNAGFDGYSTMQERDRFARDLVRLRPRKLVLVVNANDIMSEAENRRSIDASLGVNPHLRGVRSVLFYEGFYRLYLWLRYERRRLSDAEMEAYYLDAVSKTRPAAVWSEWTRAVLAIRDLAAPTEFYVVHAPPRVQVRAAQNGSANFWLNDALEAFCRAQGIPYLDLLPILARHDAATMYIDRAHLSEAGHELAAQELTRLVALGHRR